MATLIKHNGEWKKVDADSLPVTEMPASADVDTVLLYTGETNAYYTKGHTYQYQQTSLEPVSYGWVDISMNGVQPLFQVDLGGADPSSYSDTAIYQALTDGTTSDGVTVTKGHFYTTQENESSGDWEWTEVSLSDSISASDVSYSNSSSGLSASNVQGAIDEVNTKVDNLPAPVTPKGTIAFASLPALASVEVGWMYNISDDFTTTSDFVISGISEKAGSNVYCIDARSGVKKWDVFATSGETMVIDQAYNAASNNAQSGTAVAGAISVIKNALFPVGSVYMTIGNTNPATLLGFGTWSKLSDGYLRVGGSAATGGSLTTGGHTLTKAEMPSHNHSITHTHNVKGNTGAMSGNSTGTINAKSNNNSGFETMWAWASGNASFAEEGTGKAIAATSSDKTIYSKINIDVSHTHSIDLTSGDPSNANSGNAGSGNAHTHSIEPTYTRIYAWQRTA